MGEKIHFVIFCAAAVVFVLHAVGYLAPAWFVQETRVNIGPDGIHVDGRNFEPPLMMKVSMDRNRRSPETGRPMLVSNDREIPVPPKEAEHKPDDDGKLTSDHDDEEPRPLQSLPRDGDPVRETEPKPDEERRPVEDLAESGPTYMKPGDNPDADEQTSDHDKGERHPSEILPPRPNTDNEPEHKADEDVQTLNPSDDKDPEDIRDDIKPQRPPLQRNPDGAGHPNDDKGERHPSEILPGRPNTDNEPNHKPDEDVQTLNPSDDKDPEDIRDDKPQRPPLQRNPDGAGHPNDGSDLPDREYRGDPREDSDNAVNEDSEPQIPVLRPRPDLPPNSENEDPPVKETDVRETDVVNTDIDDTDNMRDKDGDGKTITCWDVNGDDLNHPKDTGPLAGRDQEGNPMSGMVGVPRSDEEQTLEDLFQTGPFVYVTAGLWYGRICINSEPPSDGTGKKGHGNEWCTLYSRTNGSTLDNYRSLAEYRAEATVALVLSFVSVVAASMSRCTQRRLVTRLFIVLGSMFVSGGLMAIPVVHTLVRHVDRHETGLRGRDWSRITVNTHLRHDAFDHWSAIVCGVSSIVAIVSAIGLTIWAYCVSRKDDRSEKYDLKQPGPMEAGEKSHLANNWMFHSTAAPFVMTLDQSLKAGEADYTVIDDIETESQQQDTTSDKGSVHDGGDSIKDVSFNHDVNLIDEAGATKSE